MRLQRHSHALLALADRWTTVAPRTGGHLNPFQGAEDLNSEVATALEGVLFMEGEGRPAEITAMIADLRRQADTDARSGEWLANAMQASWQMAAAMLQVDGLADVMGERHRIISNDWLAAHMPVAGRHHADPRRRHAGARRARPGCDARGPGRPTPGCAPDVRRGRGHRPRGRLVLPIG